MDNLRLFQSRPDNNRLQKELDTYDVLERLDIPFMGADHGPAMTMEDLQDIEASLGIKVGKNLFLCNSSKSKFYMLIMPGDKKFLTKDLSKQINSSRLSFAGGSYMEELLNITPGALSVFGLMYDKDNKVSLIIDNDVLDNEYFGCHPCVNTSTLKVKTSDVLEKFLPYAGHEPTIVNL